MTVRFSNQLVAESIQPFWAAWRAGEFMTDASAIAGTYRNRGLAGFVRPGACARATQDGRSIASIADRRILAVIATGGRRSVRSAS